MKPASKPISFRISAQLSKRLEAEASEHGMSCGEYARKLLVDALDDTQSEWMRNEITALHETVAKLREDLATATAALLARGEPMSAAEALAWVKSRGLG